ncbi:hypothetical protein GCM10010177_50080 [Actinomadura citrea]|nr:hypothetical protein GCM10010177_50080 [Actinomadura citrea]
MRGGRLDEGEGEGGGAREGGEAAARPPAGARRGGMSESHGASLQKYVPVLMGADMVNPAVRDAIRRALRKAAP